MKVTACKIFLDISTDLQGDHCDSVDHETIFCPYYAFDSHLMTTYSNETSKADPTRLGHIISSDYYMITLKILRPDQYFGIYIYCYSD